MFVHKEQLRHGLIYLFININQLDALNFFNKFISSPYMFRAHVLETCRGLK